MMMISSSLCGGLQDLVLTQRLKTVTVNGKKEKKKKVRS